jgi:hypothetical protein
MFPHSVLGDTFPQIILTVHNPDQHHEAADQDRDIGNPFYLYLVISQQESYLNHICPDPEQQKHQQQQENREEKITHYVISDQTKAVIFWGSFYIPGIGGHDLAPWVER